MQRAQPDDYISLADFVADPANHSPRQGGGNAVADRGQYPVGPPERPGNEDTLSVVDEATGTVRVMSDRCGTCIGRSGNPAGLTARRRNELLGRRDDGTYDEGHTVCHCTLPGNSYGLLPAVCAWIAQHPQAAPRSLAMRMAASVGIQYVDPPACPPQSDPVPRTGG